MEPEELAALEDEADVVLANRIAASSRNRNRKSTVRFFKWIIQHKRQLVRDPFVAQLSQDTDGVPTSESLRLALAAAPRNPPIYFERLTARDFCTWIMSMKNEDGKYFMYSTYANHRSALGCSYRDYGASMAAEVLQDIANRFSGQKKSVVRQAGAGQSQIKVCKDPSHSAYSSDLDRRCSLVIHEISFSQKHSCYSRGMSCPEQPIRRPFATSI